MIGGRFAKCDTGYAMYSAMLQTELPRIVTSSYTSPVENPLENTMRIQVQLFPKETACFSIAHKSVTADVAEFEITHHMIVFEKLLINNESVSLTNVREQSEYPLKDDGKKLMIEWFKTEKDESSWRKQISEIAKQYKHGWNVGFKSTCSGIKTLKAFQGYQQNRELSKYPLVPVADLKEAFHFFNIVLTSYGWKGLNTFGYGNTYLVDFIRPKSNEKVVREHLHLPKEHILIYSERVKAFKPAYFAIYDEQKDAIVVVVRGTMSPEDVVTDFVCNYFPYQGGYVHEGMFKGASRVFEEIRPSLKLWSEKFNTKKVVLTGHSLGGGIAVLLSRMIIDAANDYVVNAFVFASPPALTASLLPLFTHVVSVVNHNDFVCRASYGAAVRLRDHIAVIDEFKDKPIDKLYLELEKPVEPRFPQVILILT